MQDQELVNTIFGETDRAAKGIMAQIARGNYPWWMPDKAKEKMMIYSAYTAVWTPIPASGTQPRNIQIQSGSSFVVMSMVLVETDTNNTLFLPNRPLLMNWIDTASGNQVSDAPMHVDNWFGTVEDPNYLEFPRILAPGSTQQFTLQNLEATDRNVRIALRGFRIFNFTPDTPPGAG